MCELYWISVIDKLNTLFCAIFSVSIALSIALTLVYFILEDNESKNTAKRILKLSIINVVVFGLGIILTPSKNDAYLIYGAGTIVDYCKDNQKVKEIPDKAIDALNRYLDSISEKEE